MAQEHQRTDGPYYDMFEDQEMAFTPLSPQFSAGVPESNTAAADPITNQTTLPTRRGPTYSYPNAVTGARAGSQHLIPASQGSLPSTTPNPGAANSPSPSLLAPTIGGQGGSPVYATTPVPPYGFQPSLTWNSSSGYTSSGDSASNSQFFEMSFGRQDVGAPHGPSTFPTEFIAPSSIQQPNMFEGFGPNPWHESNEGITATSNAGVGDDAQMTLTSTEPTASGGGNIAVNPGSIPNPVDAASSRHKRAKKSTSSSTREPPTSPGASTTASHMSRNSLASSKSGQSSVAATTGSGGAAAASMGSAGGNKSKLRSASRASKNTHHKPAETAEERKTRASHNLVEKQYRNRLNTQFENLLNSLPELSRSGEGGEEDDGEGDGDRRVSKAEVLDMARRHIKQLEKDKLDLEVERDQLLQMMESLREAYAQGIPPQNPAGMVPLEAQPASIYQSGPGLSYQTDPGPSYGDNLADDDALGSTQAQQ